MLAKILRSGSHSRSLFVLLLIAFLAGGGFLFVQASMAANLVWDGGGETNDWNEAANWSLNRVPGPTDIAIFNATSSKPAVIRSNINVGSIQLATGYTGTVTQEGGATITTNSPSGGGGDIIVTAGTFIGGSGQITVADQFTVNGGSFQAPSGTLLINGGDFRVTSGTFTPGTGRVEFRTAAISVNVNVTQQFHNVTIAPGNNLAVAIASGDVMIVNGELTLLDGVVNTGGIQARGNISQASTFDGGSSFIGFDSPETQIYTLEGGIAPGIRLDAPDDALDSIVFQSGTTVTSFTVTNTFNGNIPINNALNRALTFRAWSQAAGTYDASAQSNWSFGDFDRLGGSFAPPASVTANGAAATWDVATSQNWRDFTLAKNANAALTIAGSDVHIITGTLRLVDGLARGGTIRAEGNVNTLVGYDGGTSILLFGGSADQTFYLGDASNVYNGDITVNKTGGQVLLASSLVMDAANQDLTIQKGTFNINGRALTINGSTGKLSVLNTGEFKLMGHELLTLNAGQPTLATGSTVTYTGDANGQLSVFDITKFKNVYHHLTISAADALDTFELKTALDVNGNLSLVSGKLDVTAGNYPVNVAGNWTNTGVFDAHSNTVTLDGVNQVIAGQTAFHNLTKVVTRAATLTLPSEATQQITGALRLNGASLSNRLTIQSSVPGTRAALRPEGTRDVRNVAVKDIANDHATNIVCNVGCLNLGNNLNWEFPAYTISSISGDTTEAGGRATYTIVLNMQPASNVVFTIASTDLTEGIVSPATLTFTRTTWSSPRTVTVAGVNDLLADGDVLYTITNTVTSTDPNFQGLPPGVVQVLNVDDDDHGVEVTESDDATNVTEGGASDTYSLVLRSAPTANVTVRILGDVDVDTDLDQIEFTPTNWNVPQTITVVAINDRDAEGAHTGRIQHFVESTDPTYNGISVATVTANITNNDLPPTPPPTPLPPPLTVTAPVGGERFVGGDPITIRWSTTRSDMTRVSIAVSFDGGASFATILSNQVLAEQSFVWLAPNVTTSAARVRVSAAGVDSFGVGYTVADFSIVPRIVDPTPPPPTPTPQPSPTTPSNPRGGTGFVPPSPTPSAPTDDRNSPGPQPSAPDDRTPPEPCSSAPSGRENSGPTPSAPNDRESSGPQPSAPNNRNDQEAQPSAPDGGNNPQLPSSSSDGRDAPEPCPSAPTDERNNPGPTPSAPDDRNNPGPQPSAPNDRNNPGPTPSQGDYVRTKSGSTVYLFVTDANGAQLLRPFIDAPTFFTYETSFDVVKVFSDEILAQYPLGAPMLPKAGVTLVKFTSREQVYFTEESGSEGILLRWITSEEIARLMLGDAWMEYVIELPESLIHKYVTGEPIDEASDANASLLRKRSELESGAKLAAGTRVGMVAGAVSERYLPMSGVPGTFFRLGKDLALLRMTGLQASSLVAGEIIEAFVADR